jgi:hypothetical protein
MVSQSNVSSVDLVTPELASTLTPAAYIEGHQPQILEAKKRMANRVARQGQEEADRA